MSIPFNEYEKRFLLAEVLKTSNTPLEVFRSIIIEEHIEPKWDEIFIPPGRNVNTSRAAYQELMSSTSGFIPSSTTVGPQIASSRKRRLSESEANPAIARTLHPKPAANGARVASFSSPSDPGAKKRGRPTKEVLQARKEAAAARSFQYPTLKAAARTSLGAPAGAEMSFALEGSPSETSAQLEGGFDSPSSKKRRGRPPKKDTEGEGEGEGANSDQKIQEVAAKAMSFQTAPEAAPKVVGQHVEMLDVVGSTQTAPALAAIPEKKNEVPDRIEAGPTPPLEHKPSTSS